jgi:epoxyqueuosine reductase QueG
MFDNATVKKLALDCGADLVGIASVESFASQPREANPKYIKPDAQSIIVLAFSIPRGALRGVEEGTAWQTYGVGNPSWGMCVECTYLFCRKLENAGFEAVPLFNHSHDLRNQGVSVSPDKPEPNVIMEMDFAAQAAGLGEVGKGKFFLTPEFGPRQIFTAIVTDLAVEPDKPFAGKICDDCHACADACPAKAMDTKNLLTTPMVKGAATCFTLHVESCSICKTGTASLAYSKSSEPCRIGAACGRACVAHLEDGGKLTRKFKYPYRESSSK